MTEAVAGLSGVAATSDRAVLHRSERGARLVGALDVALRAMRPQPPAPDFAAQIEAAAASARPPAREPAPASSSAPAPAVQAAPALSVPAPPAIIRAEIPSAPPPSDPVEQRQGGPLDIMRWSRGVVPRDEMAELGASLDADRPKPVAPDVAALSRAQENHMPRDVLEALRERHLGMIGGGDVR